MPPDAPSFAAWLSETWADIVGHPDPVQRARHVLAGTAVDVADALTARDPKRIAIYFGKHADPTGATKAYQNHPPASWSEGGKSVGRFWGYLGLGRVAEEVELTDADFVRLSRTLRRLARVRVVIPYGARYSTVIRPAVRRVRVQRVDRRTGAVRYRYVTRRVRLFRGHVGGFLLANDGVALGEAARRIFGAC